MGLRISIICVARAGHEFSEQVDRYISMSKSYAAIECVTIKSPGKGVPEILMAREAELIRERLPKKACTIALCPEGKTYDSQGFAHWLSGVSASGEVPVFIIGGAFGISPALKQECRARISLSPLTFSHQLCHVVLVEQLYRAFTILHNHPYHK